MKYPDSTSTPFPSQDTCSCTQCYTFHSGTIHTGRHSVARQCDCLSQPVCSHTDSHSSQTQSDCRVSPEPVGLFRICATHWLHSRSNRLLNLLAYFVFSTLSVAAVRIWCQKNLMPESDRFRIRRHCWHRSARARNQLHSTHAWTILILSSPCVQCVFRTIYFISASIIVYVHRTVK